MSVMETKRMEVSPYNPLLLRKSVLATPLRVFLCGPGYGSTRYHFRENIRGFLASFPNVETVLGEEIDPKKHGIKRSDLQTSEIAFAQLADFTVLLLESPGALAELGTFSTMSNIRPRLFVMVPDRFYKAESYISRGPLSALAKEHINNVIYYDEAEQDHAIRKLQMPVQLFKFAKHINTFFPYASGSPSAPKHSYEQQFKRVRARYFELIVLVAINILGEATFPMIVASTKLHPNDIRQALGSLVNTHSVARRAQFWAATTGFRDARFGMVNTYLLSNIRAKHIALP